MIDTAKTHHNLLRLGEVVAGVAVQRKLSKRCEGDNVLGHNLGRVEKIESKAQLVLLLHDLSLEDPFREHSLLNTLKQVLAVVVRVQSSSDLSLLPQERSLALCGPEPELDELGLALISDKAEGVNTPSVHVPVRTDGSMAAHCPEQGVERRWLLTEKVPSAVMSGGGLRNLTIRPGLNSMDQIRELNGILNEEDRNVVTNNI